MDHIASVFFVSYEHNSSYLLLPRTCCGIFERYRGKHLLLESLVVIKSAESIFSKPTG